MDLLNNKFWKGIIIIGILILVLAGCDNNPGVGNGTDTTALSGTVYVPQGSIDSAYLHNDLNFFARIFDQKVIALEGNAVLPNATVVIKDFTSEEVLATTQTDENGEYAVSEIPEGKDVLVVVTIENNGNNIRLSSVVPDVGKQNKVSGDVDLATSIIAENIIKEKNTYKNPSSEDIGPEIEVVRNMVQERLRQGPIDISVGRGIFGGNLGDEINDDEFKGVLGLGKAKSFVHDLRNHGINLTEVGKQQAQQIKENVENNVIPYTLALGGRFYTISQVFNVWNGMMDSEYLPGDYTYNLVSEDFVETAPTSENLEKLSDWVWNITFVEGEELLYEVSISISNLNDIMTEGDVANTYYIDFTQAEFHYEQTSLPDNGNIDWVFNYILSSESTKEITYEDEIDGLYKYHITLPRDATATGTGTMTDDMKFTKIIDEQEQILPDIGTVTFNSSLSIDLDTVKQITYDGSFDTKEIDFEGNTTINFDSFPSFQDIVEGNTYPQIASYSSQGTYLTAAFSLGGSTDIDFTSENITDSNSLNITISLPSDIALNGFYNDLTENTEFEFKGDLGINFNYDDFSIDLSKEEPIESENNYLGVAINLKGSLLDMSYINSEDIAVENVTLDLNLVRDDFQHLTANFAYNYGDDKIIQGKADFGKNEGFDLIAENGVEDNERNLVIKMSDYEYDGQQKIGEIKRKYDNKLLGEIVADEIPYILFGDGTSEYLLGEK